MRTPHTRYGKFGGGVRYLRSILFPLLACFTVGLTCLAQEATPTPTPGSLDPSYGVNGFATTVISPSNWAVDVAVQGDGKAVVAVHGANPSGSGSDFYAARFDAAGYLDPGFGSGGVVRLQFTSAADAEHVEAVAVQPDGKILLAGYAYVKGSSYGFAVARLNQDGSLDTSFGSGGKVLFSVAQNTVLRGMALQLGDPLSAADDRVVLAGFSTSSGNDCALARLTSAGKLDATFGSGGKVIIQNGKSGSDGGCGPLAFQRVNGQERIVVAGARPGSTQGPRDFLIMRLTPAGALDASFGTGGKVFTDFGGTLDGANAVAVVGDGIIAGGRATSNTINNSTSKFVFAKYALNGQLDPSFGVGGKVTAEIPNSAIFGGMVIQPDGKIVAGGPLNTDASGTPRDFALVRYNADGSPDITFGPAGDGRVVTDYMWVDFGPYGLALQADGKILAAGGAYPTTPGPSVYVVLMRHVP